MEIILFCMCYNFCDSNTTVISYGKIFTLIISQSLIFFSRESLAISIETIDTCTLKMDRWMKAEKVNTIDEMKEVFLMEHFINQVPPNIRYELISNEVKEVMEAGRRADSFVKAHGLSRFEQGEGE